MNRIDLFKVTKWENELRRIYTDLDNELKLEDTELVKHVLEWQQTNGRPQIKRSSVYTQMWTIHGKWLMRFIIIATKQCMKYGSKVLEPPIWNIVYDMFKHGHGGFLLRGGEKFSPYFVELKSGDKFMEYLSQCFDDGTDNDIRIEQIFTMVNGKHDESKVARIFQVIADRTGNLGKEAHKSAGYQLVGNLQRLTTQTTLPPSFKDSINVEDKKKKEEEGE